MPQMLKFKSIERRSPRGTTYRSNGEASRTKISNTSRFLPREWETKGDRAQDFEEIQRPGCNISDHPFVPNLALGPAFKRTDQEVIDFYSRSSDIPISGVPKFDHRRLVDGQRRLTFFKPLSPSSHGRAFEVRSKVLGAYGKGNAGSVVETETVLAERGGDEYTRAVGSAFFVGQGSWGGPKDKQRVRTSVQASGPFLILVKALM
ncbi:MAG: hypothetical protein Q9203_001468 [Teloschistes exilis]